MRKFVIQYTDVLTKANKPVVQDIKEKIKLLDPTKPIPHYKLQIMSERQFKEV